MNETMVIYIIGIMALSYLVYVFTYKRKEKNSCKYGGDCAACKGHKLL